jgi:ribose transport system substrate-binding protein
VTKAALRAARAAHVKLFGLHALDCSDPTAGSGKGVWDAGLGYGPQFPDERAVLLGLGATKADWVIAEAGAGAEVIEFRRTDLALSKLVNDGFDAELRSHCPRCVLDTVTYTATDLGPKATAKAHDALVRHPTATAVMVPDDLALTFGIGSAIDGSGRKPHLKVIGGEGFSTNIDAARAGRQQDAGTGYGFEWDGWAAVDGMNRLFAGVPQVDCGCGFRVWDVGPPAHNLPPPGEPYQPAADFKANYRRIWGVS